MNIQISDRTPYTYLIGWAKLNIYYYGVRYAEGCHPDELWKNYFTSSNSVEQARLLYGEPDIQQIRRTFEDIQTARLWEHRVLKRMKVIYRDDYLNKTDNISIAPQFGDDNAARRPEVQEKISIGMVRWYETNDHPNLGVKWSEEEKQEWSKLRTGENNPFYGHKHTEENIKLYSERQHGKNNSFYGKSHSDSQIAKWSKERSGIPKPRVCCIHCRNEVAINLFTRWHGDNCKKR